MPQVTYLPVLDTIKSAWDKVSGAKASIWAAFGVMFLILLAFGFVQGCVQYFSHGLGSVVSFFLSLVNFLLTAGLMYLGLERAFNRPINYKLVFHCFEGNIALKLIGYYVLLVLIILAISGIGIGSGALLLKVTQQNWIFPLFAVITGLFVVYILVRLALSIFLIIDKRVGPIDAIKLSFKATQSNFWNLFFVWVLTVFILVISAIPFGIGLIWTLPFCYICGGEIYKRLLPNTGTYQQ